MPAGEGTNSISRNNGNTFCRVKPQTKIMTVDKRLWFYSVYDFRLLYCSIVSAR